MLIIKSKNNMKSEDFMKWNEKKKKYLKKLLHSIDIVLQNSLGRNWGRKKGEDLYFVA